MIRLEEKEADEAKKKEEEARNEFRRKLAEKEHEITMKAKIFGNKSKLVEGLKTKNHPKPVPSRDGKSSPTSTLQMSRSVTNSPVKAAVTKISRPTTSSSSMPTRVPSSTSLRKTTSLPAANRNSPVSPNPISLPKQSKDF